MRECEKTLLLGVRAGFYFFCPLIAEQKCE